MTKKIILDVLKKSKWSILSAIIVFVVLYQYANPFIFIYLLFVQIWMIYDNYEMERLQEANDRSAELINKINTNLSEFRKIYDDLIAYIKDDKDIH
jgi:hypothetical protein